MRPVISSEKVNFWVGGNMEKMTKGFQIVRIARKEDGLRGSTWNWG